MLIPRQIACLGKIAAKDSTRYAMSAIRIERHRGQPRAMATDGRRAVIFSWLEPDASGFPPIAGLSSRPVPDYAANIPPKALADAGRGIARTTRPILEHLLLDESSPELVRLATTTLDNITRSEAHAEEGDFPPVEDVLPNPAREGALYDHKRHGELPCSHIRIGVNAKLLAQTLEVLAQLAADDSNNTVVLTIPVSGTSPLRLDARSPERQAVAAVMPVSVDYAAYDQPAEPEEEAVMVAAA
jgi:hypothetical protein